VKLQEAEDVLDDPNASDDAKAQAAGLLDTFQKFGRNIAMGFGKIRDALDNDDIDVPARFARVADAIQIGDTSADQPPFAFLTWLLDNNQPGAMGAAMIFKATGQRRALTKQLLGRDYVNPDDAGELVKRLAPEGYRTWQPDEGKLLFTVKTLPEHVIDGMLDKLEHVIDGMLDKLDQPDGISADDLRAVLESARPQLALGGDRYTMILPEEVADTLSNLRRDEMDGLFKHLVKEPVRLWKRWVLINTSLGAARQSGGSWSMRSTCSARRTRKTDCKRLASHA